MPILAVVSACVGIQGLRQTKASWGCSQLIKKHSFTVNVSRCEKANQFTELPPLRSQYLRAIARNPIEVSYWTQSLCMSHTKTKIYDSELLKLKRRLLIHWTARDKGRTELVIFSRAIDLSQYLVGNNVGERRSWYVPFGVMRNQCAHYMTGTWLDRAETAKVISTGKIGASEIDTSDNETALSCMIIWPGLMLSREWCRAPSCVNPLWASPIGVSDLDLVSVKVKDVLKQNLHFW